MSADSINHLSTEDILMIHELIVESNEATEAGVSSPGDIEYTVGAVQDGHFGQKPESIHEKAYQLLRLLAANHPFVDGNKRTALMSVRIFYALNGFKFEYDKEIKEILKELATDQASVNDTAVLFYLQKHTKTLAPEYETTINLWLSEIKGRERQSGGLSTESADEPNDYDDSPPTEEQE